MVNIHFSFVVPTRNSSKTLKQALGSVAFQSYDNWDMIIVDDVSTDDTVSKIQLECQKLKIEEKVKIIQNSDRRWEIQNTLEALKYVESDSIVCRLDLDDYLCDLNALDIMSQAYQKIPDLDVTWSNQRWFSDGKLTNFNISRELPYGADPYVHTWVSSHFKSFRKSTIEHVNEDNFKDENGNYFKRIGDQAFMLPAIKNARKYVYIPHPFYAYRCSLEPETFQTEDAKFQKSEAEFLRKRGFVK